MSPTCASINSETVKVEPSKCSSNKLKGADTSGKHIFVEELMDVGRKTQIWVISDTCGQIKISEGVCLPLLLQALISWHRFALRTRSKFLPLKCGFRGETCPQVSRASLCSTCRKQKQRFAHVFTTSPRPNEAERRRQEKHGEEGGATPAGPVVDPRSRALDTGSTQPTQGAVWTSFSRT